MRVRCALALALLVPLAGAAPRPATVHDWPAWRGVDRTAQSAETGLSRQWPAEGPPLLARVTGLGEGYSAPSVAGGSIYLMGNRDGQEWLWALDRQNPGSVAWQTALGPVRHDGAGYPGPRSTPTVAGQRVLALGLNGDLVCCRRDNGKIVWRKQLVDELGGTVPTWGYCESLLVDGAFVVCTPGGARATLAALDIQSGQVIWAAPVGDGAGYSSVVRAEILNVPTYVQFTAAGLIGLRAADGQLLWRYNRPANGTANVSTPLVAGELVFAASGYGTGGGQVQIVRRGQQFEALEKYFSKDMKNHHGGMILREGFLFGSNDPGLLTCLNFETGEVVWKSREPGKCSLVYADGLLITRSEDGPVCLVEANPREYRLLGRFEQPDRSPAPSWPHPVIADGRLYLRDQDLLLVYDLKAR